MNLSYRTLRKAFLQEMNVSIGDTEYRVTSMLCNVIDPRHVEYSVVLHSLGGARQKLTVTGVGNFNEHVEPEESPWDYYLRETLGVI